MTWSLILLGSALAGLTLLIFTAVLLVRAKLPRLPFRVEAAREILPSNAAGTIFVSVPSFRDPDCGATIADAFRKAQYPERLRVGVCDQRAPHETAVMNRDELAPFRARIAAIDMDYREAKGPMYARALIEQHLYLKVPPRDRERYVLMVDSHMRFAPGWDRLAIAQMQACPDPDHSLLTCYPPDVGNERSARPTFLRFKAFDTNSDGVPTIEGPAMAAVPPAPVPTHFWAACFSFMPGALIAAAPIPDDFPYLFFGEEFLLAARYASAGFQAYHPVRVIAYHRWSRAGRPTFFGAVEADAYKKKKRDESYRKLRALFHGPKASYADFVRSSGVDYVNGHVEKRARSGLTERAGKNESDAKH